MNGILNSSSFSTISFFGPILVQTYENEIHAAKFLDIAGVQIDRMIDDAAMHFSVEILEIRRLGQSAPSDHRLTAAPGERKALCWKNVSPS